MSDTVVIFNSQTGFTKRYAQWISEALSCDCMELETAKKSDLDKYGTIIFGGWACAGSISKLNWFKKNMPKWEGKRLAVFCVGGSPNDNPEVETALKNCLSDEEHKKAEVFYCQGGFNYEKMPAPSKLMMKMFIASLKAKKNKTEAEEIMIKMISGSYDISDKKYIEPIVLWAGGGMG